MTTSEAARAAYIAAQAAHMTDEQIWEAVAQAVLDSNQDRQRIDWMESAISQIPWSMKSSVVLGRTPKIVNASPGQAWCDPFCKAHPTLRDALDHSIEINRVEAVMGGVVRE